MLLLFCYLSVYVIILQLEDNEDLSQSQAAAMAALAVIGGIDGRPRLGGLVRHEEYGQGTVAKIMPNGKVTVQFHSNNPRNHDNNQSDSNQARIVRLSELTHVRLIKSRLTEICLGKTSFDLCLMTSLYYFC